jgi:hypothetical protein
MIRIHLNFLGSLVTAGVSVGAFTDSVRAGLLTAILFIALYQTIVAATRGS